ncbi:MAG: DUF1501 domain-containing protein [Gemmataceae bacterium]
MLKIVGNAASDCTGASRRNFLKAGALGGLSLAGLHRLQAETQAIRRDTSVILFWLSGGPGHMETWDPKPDAVDQFRGPFASIRTRLPGVQFGELMPETARIADKLAILRGVNHGSGDHTKANHWMLTGFEGPAFNVPDFMVQRRPSMGSAAAKLRGTNVAGMPAYSAVPHLRGGTDNFFHYAAYLGAAANPFITEADPNLPNFRVRGLSLAPELSFERLGDRRTVLDSLNQFQRSADRHAGSHDSHLRQAFDLLTSRPVAQAYEIGAEPDRIRDRYGRHTFGQSALLARRLVEAGVTFVTVNCVPWDHHATAGRLPTREGSLQLIPPLDRAIAALVEDLIQRGLYEKTLVIAMGEFGRTPRMNPEGGRDHWGHAFSVLMASGGMSMGQVVGRSTPRGEYVADRPTSPQDVTATVFRHLGIDASKVFFHDAQSRPVALVESGEPIRELVG